MNAIYVEHTLHKGFILQLITVLFTSEYKDIYIILIRTLQTQFNTPVFITLHGTIKRRGYEA